MQAISSATQSFLPPFTADRVISGGADVPLTCDVLHCSRCAARRLRACAVDVVVECERARERARFHGNTQAGRTSARGVHPRGAPAGALRAAVPAVTRGGLKPRASSRRATTQRSTASSLWTTQARAGCGARARARAPTGLCV